jgi:NAD(P)-dependent dehydrogenase (short-subunit alcohol dehydrogenase family)
VSFRDKSVFITGSVQGIGLAVAERLGAAGAEVILHGLEESRAEEALARVRATGAQARFVGGDLAKGQPGNIVEIVERVWNEGPVDLLVCNAGTYIDDAFLDMSYQKLDLTLRLNVYAYFLTVQEVAKRWVDAGTKGRIVLVGSINGRLAEDKHVAYDASKGAVEAMVRSLAVSLAPHGIRVNGMAPGLLYTPLTAPALDDARVMQWMNLHTPSGEVPGPEACASTVEFLLSDDAWHIRGQMIFVDGGMSAWQQPDPPAGSI